MDDVPENVRLLEAVLAPRGYDVVSASDGRAALELAASAKPDLVLLDVVMPELDGYDGLPTAPRARGDGRAARDHAHGERRPREDAGDRGRRGRLHREAVQPRRAVRASPLAAPDQALPRHDHRAEPNARGARAGAGRGARAVAAAAAVPLAAARRRDRLVGRRLDPCQPSPAGRDVLRRPPRLDELRRRGRAGRADAGARRVPRDDRPSRQALRRDGRLPRGRRSPALLQRPDRDPRRRRCGRCGSVARYARRWPS